MKRNNTTQLSIVTIVIILALFASCKKLVEVDPPRNQLITSIVFKDSSDATSAIVGMYATIMQFSTSVNFGSGAITVFTGLAADEIYSNSTDVTQQQFYTNAVSPQNEETTYWWVFAYQLIYQANACIEGLLDNTTLKSEVRNQLLGEAKFVRAWLYFNLVNLYGDVPLATSINYHTNSVMARTTSEQVYNQIINDLADAQQLLPGNYITTGRLRPNLYTATALLSRAYLYFKQWDKAEAEASKVINSGHYSLEPNLNDVFKKVSNEILWQMPPLQTPIGVSETFQFIPFNSSRIPNFSISNSLLAAFENGDQRKINWVNSRTIQSQTYFIPFKYKLLISSTSEENYVIFRFAEQYLIRSEARTRQNNLTNALADLNMIRSRAGLTTFASNSQDDILSAILQERRVELFCETGHRWYDLKRTGTINSVLGLVKPGWQTTDALFPIPMNELQVNPFLVQNPGY